MRINHIGWLFYCLLFLSACDKSSVPEKTISSEKATPITTPEGDLHILSVELFTVGEEAIKLALQSTSTLHQSITAFLAEPTGERLAQAQSKWRTATLAYRRFNGARQLGLVAPEIFSRLNRLDYQIASFPIQPGFLDKFGAYHYSGLVHDIGFPLTEASLTNQHGLTDLSDVVLGFYAMEFLLFNVNEPRDIGDFLPVTSLTNALQERGFENINEVPNNRRRELLRQQSKILLSDLQTLQSSWHDTDEASIRIIWQRLTLEKKTETARAALENALAQLMIDLAELHREASASANISPSIKAGGFTVHQKYINFALTGLTTYSKFFVDGNERIHSFLSKADAATKIEKPKNGATGKKHWRDVLSNIKEASNALSQY